MLVGWGAQLPLLPYLCPSLFSLKKRLSILGNVTGRPLEGTHTLILRGPAWGRHGIGFLTFPNLALLCLQSPNWAMPSNSQLDSFGVGLEDVHGSTKRALIWKWEMCGLVTWPPANLETLGKSTFFLPFCFITYKMRSWSHIEDFKLRPEELSQGHI